MADAELTPLADHGGPARTHALLPASPALDSGDPACGATDQRGIARPQGAGCDRGAFERSAAVPALGVPARGLVAAGLVLCAAAAMRRRRARYSAMSGLCQPGGAASSAGGSRRET